MDGTGPNAPVMNLDDFFGNGITLAQYERKEEPQEHKQPEAQAMNVDLIDMNAFVMDEEEEKTEASSQQPQATIQNTDFLQDEDVLLREDKPPPPRIAVLDVWHQSVPAIEDVVPETPEVPMPLQRLRRGCSHRVHGVAEDQRDVFCIYPAATKRRTSAPRKLHLRGTCGLLPTLSAHSSCPPPH